MHLGNGRERGRVGGRERGREGGREKGRERGREGEREHACHLAAVQYFELFFFPFVQVGEWLYSKYRSIMHFMSTSSSSLC